MTATLTLRQIGLILISVPLAFGLSFVVFLSIILNHSAQEFDRIQGSRLALSQLRDNQMIVAQLIITTLACWDKSSDDAVELIDLSLGSIHKSRDAVLIKENHQPQMRRLIDKSIHLIDKAASAATKAKEVFRDNSLGNPSRFVLIRDDIFDLVIDMSKLRKSIIDSEQAIKLQAPTEAQSLRRRIAVTLAIGLGSSLILSLGLAILFSRNILRRLRNIELHASSLGEGTELFKPTANGDELSELDRIIYDSAAALEEARRRERAILDNAGEVLCSLNEDLEILTLGAPASRLWMRSPDELKGKSISDLLSQPLAADFKSHCNSLSTSNSKEAIEFDSKIMLPNGTERDIRWNLHWSTENSIFFCIARDTTEAKAIEAMKQRLVAIVSHDLRTPLSSVSNTISLLLAGKRGELAPSVVNELRKSEDNLAQLMELVRDLLDLERLEGGVMKLESSCVSAVDVCSIARETTQMLANEKQVTVEPPFGDAAMQGDERRILQVVTVFLKQAIGATPPRSTVRFTIAEMDGFVEIGIIDQGAPIREAEISAIFERFAPEKANADSSTRRGNLTLALAKAIADAHNGALGVRNISSAGKAFWIRIPRYEMAEPEEAGGTE